MTLDQLNAVAKDYKDTHQSHLYQVQVEVVVSGATHKGKYRTLPKSVIVLADTDGSKPTYINLASVLSIRPTE